MPYTIRKIPNKSCYKIMNKRTKKVFSKCTSKNKAEKQLRLLRALQYNKTFVPYSKQKPVRLSRGGNYTRKSSYK